MITNLLWAYLIGGIVSIFVTFGLFYRAAQRCDGSAHKIDKFMRWLIHGFMFGVYLILVALMWPNIGGAEIAVLAFFGWIVLPIKHPADYRNLSSWWADRRNWHRNI